jgi:hypothetical protein
LPAANSLWSRQDIGGSISSQLGNLPSQCKDTCDPVVQAASSCTTANQACLDALCASNVQTAYGSCVDCVISAAGSTLDDQSKQLLESAKGQLTSLCGSQSGASA